MGRSRSKQGFKNSSPRGKGQKSQNKAHTKMDVKKFLRQKKALKRNSIHGILNSSNTLKDSPNSNGLYKRRHRRSNRANRSGINFENGQNPQPGSSSNVDDCVILPEKPLEVISILDSDEEEENTSKKRKSTENTDKNAKRKRINYTPRVEVFSRYPATEAFTPFDGSHSEEDCSPSFFIDTKKEDAPILQIPLYQPANDSIICLDDTPKKPEMPVPDENPAPSTSALPKYEPIITDDVIVIADDSQLDLDDKKNQTIEEGEITEESFIPLEPVTEKSPKKSPKTQKTEKRLVILDGNNIAMAHGNNRIFSVQGIEIALKHFEKMGHDVKAIIPQFRMKLHKSSSQVLLEKLQSENKILLTPCKNLPGKVSASYDDRFIIEVAEKCDAAIISNDNYKDLLNEKPEWHKIITSRVIGFMFCGDAFFVPDDPYGKHGPKLKTILNKTTK